MPEHSQSADDPLRDVEIIVVGAGFSGLGLGIQLKRRGHESFVILERADDVGGSWRDNTYPGVACDVPSPLYSFSFRTNPSWSRMYSPGPEIFDYLKDAAAEEGLRPHLRFGADMLDARWDENAKRWTVRTPRGEFRSEILVSATGHLTDVKYPEIPGLDTFPGDLFHSARWNHDIPLEGKRIGVVGTGASAVQIVPQLAGLAERLVVFQRSAPYIRPRNDRAFSVAEKRLFQRDERSVEELRELLFWTNDYFFASRRMLPGFIDEMRAHTLNHLATQVPDPDLRAKLTPDYEVGCKRVLASDDYYPALLKPNVELEAAAFDRVEGQTVVSSAGNSFDLDVLVFATGFETYDLPSAHRIHGRGGLALSDHWAGGMQAYNSTAVTGFPNMFLVNGPGTSLGHNSIIYMIEAQVDHILAALEWRALNGGAVLEVSAEAEEQYAHRLDTLAAGTVNLRGGCSSWYVDPRNGRATLTWPDVAHRFRDQCAAFDATAYGVAAAADRS
ncbi:putative FAD-dependent monooxygenase [Actinoplanes missouriensis 431]|uniref:Putative FAD-dependent monooxygenase n=1 Tax=Actinoplanes missouriensis (strain ATCC 14538 / DSM 43046 / CBS 188.64 / JCM 3121 / NBRC 102363 / NCIMB 12654 / NRRL B-3342 / UNCC 431) TaxID=512565 RepID=I0H4L3_ACTM4|nr:NAD(P)/FAD-dependent oxidoreductase [Actinoplanes missouriensis]BAL87950.1 putative FAD-dependent monooxygenase [Actinoplanes missouriensis 431]